MKLDLYLIATRSGKPAIFSPPESLAALEAASTDRVRQSIEWMAARPSRVLAWVGRGIRSLHDYYQKLEDKIDPVERVLKAMASTSQFVVHTQIQHERSECKPDRAQPVRDERSDSTQPQERAQPVKDAFQSVLKRQRWKHMFWFSIDFVITGVVIVLTPVLMPIPGPNFFFYYPFLRLLSHYRAILGALSGLRSRDVTFKDLPELSRLEDNLPGLATFLERMD